MQNSKRKIQNAKTQEAERRAAQLSNAPLFAFCILHPA
jgi:hypothetical protein